MITVTVPASWQMLEQAVAVILQQCGFDVTLGQKLPLGRGAASVDIYAIEHSHGRQNSVICECKHWATRVPQHVVHAFRTVVSETGVNNGYIISSGGFQSGAVRAAERTNIKTVDWLEFQNEFEETWITRHFAPLIADILDPLYYYVNYDLPKAWFFRLTRADWDAFADLLNRHMSLAVASLDLSSHRMGDRPYPRLPIREWQRDTSSIPDELLVIDGYADLEPRLLELGVKAIKEFAAFHQRGRQRKFEDNHWINQRLARVGTSLQGV